jgi:predicted CopG family antitoxin
MKNFMHVSCMATKTISLELDAYERLRTSKRPGESFSDVVRRSRFENAAPTGRDLLDYFRSGGSKVNESYLDAVESAAARDRPPDNPWR